MALDTYNKTNWTPKMPITADRMNKAEDGIYDNREAIRTLDTASSNAASAITELQGTVAGYNSTNTIYNAIKEKASPAQVEQMISSAAGQGQEALTEITVARSYTDPDTHITEHTYPQLHDHLDEIHKKVLSNENRFGYKNDNGITVPAYSNSNTVYGDIRTVESNYNTLRLEVTNAHVDTINNQSYNSLSAHLDAIHTSLNTINGSITDIINSTGKDDQDHTIPMSVRMNQLIQIYNEINDAHDANVDSDSLVKRFIRDETAISGKISIDSIENNLITPDTTVNHVLDARQGRIIKELLYGPSDTAFTTSDTVASRIYGVASTVNGITTVMGDLAQAGFDDTHPVADTIAEIDDAHRDANDTLDNRFDDIETELTNAHASSIIKEDDNGNLVDKVYGSLDARLEAIETHKKSLADEIDAAHTSSIITDSHEEEVGGETVTTQVPHTYGSLDARLEAIESHAAAVRTDVNAIAGELAMVDHESIVTTNTRVDTLENDLRTMAAELDMLDGTAIVDTNTRIDGIEDEITNAHRQSGDTLDDRFDNIESLISHEAEGNDPGGLTEQLADLKDAIEDETTGLDATRTTANNAWNETIRLDGRIDNISSSVGTPTVIISEDRISYNQETGLPTIYTNSNKTVVDNTISEDKDYLLQKGDKYYYWKYIKVSTSPDVFAWKLISGDSEGNGGGNTSGYDMTAADYATLVENELYEENTDYYVTRTDGVHHYRYIQATENNETVLQEIEIGKIVDTNQIKKYNISRTTGKKKEYDNLTQTWVETDEDVEYLNLYQYDYGEDNTIIDSQAEPFAQIELPKGGDGGSSSSQKTILTRIGSEVIQKVTGSQIVLRVFFSSYDASGYESSTGYATLRAGNNIIFSNRELSSYESSTVPDPLTWQANTAGFHEFDVTEYCEAGNTVFTLSVTVGGGSPIGKTWRVNLTELRLESDAPENLLIPVDDEYAFSYIPVGTVNKTLTVTIDKNTANQQVREISIPNSISGVPSTYVLDPEDLSLGHGKHTIELQLFASIGGITEPSNKINREYIWYDINDVNTPVIIASQYEGTTINTTQYSTIEIPYQIYKKNANVIDVEYYLDDAETPYQTNTLTNTNTGTLTYIASAMGNHTLKIKVDNVYITIALAVASSDKDLSPISGMVIDFDPTTLSNRAANRLPTWNTRINGTDQTFQLIASSNFNWSEDANGGGYRKDENGDKCFVIKAGSYVDLNYPMFANDVFGNGAEMKVTFKTAAVRNAEAVWYKNVGEVSGKTVGIQLGAHSGWLKTDKAVAASTSADEDQDENTITIKGITYYYWQPNISYNPNDVRIIQKIIYRCTKAADAVDYDLENADLDEDPYKTYMKKWTKIGQLDTEIIATNSYLYFPYSEADKIELDININKSNTGNDFIMSYEDGVPSKAYAYTTGAGGDKITHNNTIRIGSDECDVYIYHLRYYVKSLSTDQILQNFIADGKDLSEKIARYDRNCIYWNPYLNDGEGGYTLTKTAQSYLDPVKLAEKIPNVKVLMLDTDIFTTSKKDFVMNSSLRCIHADGGNIYKSRGDEDNWLFINGFHAGQGTTSDNYGQSARNVDFLFEVDAVHWPSKEKNMGNYKISENPDYISTVIKGEKASEFTDNSWGTSYTEWTANTAYSLNDKVIITNNNKGTIYICSKAHTSGETFDNRNWNQIGTTSRCTDWMADDCKITLTESSVPNNYFNFKANVASSENVNNALFQKRYDDFLVYQSPAQAAQVLKHHDTYENINDVKVKNCMEFVPAVLFVRENNADLQKHVEFNDREWHFYALGNIGDSKKSDYTRAYDPDDMNEFTCENSDNNTNNGQFQSGVFTYQGQAGAIETDYSAWNETTAYETNAIVVYNGMIYTRTGATQATLGTGETYTWVAADWEAITYTGWEDANPPYFAPRTNPNPMDYTYPITPSQWNVKFGDTYLNRKHMTLVTEKFDGDHSFEFRYACKGDYRDGDLINDTNGNSDIPKDPLDLTQGYKTKDDIQFNLNHDVMLAMYEWLITSTPEQYVNEAPQWFVKNAMEFFYAYTHYYTMMDNRAKNTFWHFAKTGTHRPVSRPVEALYHIYEVADGNVTVSNGIATGNFKAPEGNFDPSGEYYTQYAFDLWVYDCDTAAGIDNNGALVFPYGKEDEDYRGEDASSGYAFNGAGSIFWRRLKTTFVDEIAEVMTRARDCFDPEHLINEFDSFQNCFPEEIWRLDIQRKYIRTYTGESIDNSITTNKQNARFLMSMMQGRKKYQRRQWIRDQSFYFNSKYKIGEIEVNKTEFNIVSPAGDHSLLAVPPDYHLHLTPYQDMYLNVVVGNGSPIPPIRAKANQEYTIKLDDYTAGNFAETRVYISGFRMISKLGGLAPMYPYAFTLSGLEHLKELDVGTDTVGYVNGNFTELPLTNKVQLPLLETLNIKNCNSLSTSIGLKTANNLRVVEAAGSNIGGISLPDYTQIQVLHLPTTVTDVILNNARFLRDFSITTANGTENYNNLYTLNIENSDYSGTYVWTENTQYEKGELLVIGNNVYRCKKDHTSVEVAMQSNHEAWASYLSTNWTLVKENTKLPIDWIDIALKMLQKQSVQIDIQLLDLYSATIGNIETLEPLSTFKDDLEAVDNSLELTGTIHVTGSYSTIEKNAYEATWSNLTLDVSQGTEQIKHKVTYVKEGAIADAHGNYADEDVYKVLFVNDGTAAPDIYSTGAITIPTKASTPEFDFVFGANDEISGDYIAYSGWKLSTGTTALTTAPIIHDTTVIMANFTRVRRQYYVRWYSEPNKLVKTANRAIYYGEGYNLENPTIKDIHAAGYETCTVSKNNGLITYSIFKGWNKLPININPDGSTRYFDIYGEWDTDTKALGDLFDDVSNLDEVQLLALSTLTDSEKETYGINNKIDISTTMTYRLGADNTASQYNGHVIVSDASQPVYLSGSTNTIGTSYQPLLANSDAFTFAIDYALNDTTYETGKNYAIIASCYHSANNVRNGFGIFKNISTGKIEVGFGDMYRYADQRVSVSTAAQSTMRNIIVLRHPKNSPTLYIYSGLRDATSIPLEEAQYQYITRREEAEFNSNAYLNIGQLISDQETIPNDDSIRTTWTKAVGTIYWAKYWEEDLGIGECKRIAAWPHEQLTLALAYSYKDPNAGMNTIRAQENVVPTPTLQLATCTNLTHGVLVQDRKNYSSFVNNFYGWKDCDARTLCNNRLLFSLPIKLQSILLKSQVPTLSVEYYDDSQAGYVYRLNNYTTLTRDYLYAYSITNVTTIANSNYSLEDPNNNPFGWRVATNVRIHTYNASNEIWSVSNSDNDGRGQFMNLRFPYKSFIGHGIIDVYRQEYDPGSYNIVQSIGASVIKSGDIYVEGDQAYIYISNREINTYGLSNYIVRGDAKFTGIADNAAENIGGGAGLGGWIRSEDYWTRSLITNGSQYTTFSEVRTDGGVNTSSIATSNPGFKVNYILAI